jgi:hypothetical protein
MDGADQRCVRPWVEGLRNHRFNNPTFDSYEVAAILGREETAAQPQRRLS